MNKPVRLASRALLILSVVLLLAPTTPGPQVRAQSIGGAGHSATLLPDGRRLVLSGQEPAGRCLSARIGDRR